jgi:hypothetical protein
METYLLNALTLLDYRLDPDDLRDIEEDGSELYSQKSVGVMSFHSPLILEWIVSGYQRSYLESQQKDWLVFDHQ